MIEDWLKCGACMSLTSDLVALGWGARTWIKSPQDSGPTFYSPDFFLQEPFPWFYHEFHQVMTKRELVSLLKLSTPSQPTLPVWQEPNRFYFDEAFDELQRLFESGTLKKSVPYIVQQAKFHFDSSRLRVSLSALLDHPSEQKMHLYGWWKEEIGILGMTPEILFRKEADSVKTVACAGTQDSRLSTQEMLEDSKLRVEQQCVIDGIVEALSPFGSVLVGERAIHNFGRLCHFVTPIEVDLNVSLNFEEIVRALHPTQAVGASPRTAGEKWLRAFDQKVPRGRYGAPFGYCDEEHTLCCVAIRNLQWSGGSQALFAGCGVISQSQREEEWQELLLKLSVIKEFLCV